MTETKTNYDNVKQWRLNNPEKLKAQKMKYRLSHKEEINAYFRKWYSEKKLKV